MRYLKTYELLTNKNKYSNFGKYLIIKSSEINNRMGDNRFLEPIGLSTINKRLSVLNSIFSI